jgi:uncharacterized membrane-anchored protein YhcB (DUF1043 family)
MLLALAAAVAVGLLVARLRAKGRRHRELADIDREYQDAVDTARQELRDIRRDRSSRS